MTTKQMDNLSIQELQRLLLKKRQAARNERLENYHSTGKVITAVGNRDSKIVAVNNIIRLDTAKYRPLKGWLDRILVLAEVCSVVILFIIALNGFSVLKTLNRDVAKSFLQPVPKPGPLIQAVVLPEGHTPPIGKNSDTQPNEAEIPVHLRPLAQSWANLPIPTPASQQAIRIQIPAIGVDAPVVQGDGWEQLKKGVAQHLGTPNPGEFGNLVLSGHNDVFGEVFRNLERLQPGDDIILFTSQRQYTYIITGTKIVQPTALEVMDPTQNASVTLISCHPYLVDNHRIVVSAVLQNP